MTAKTHYENHLGNFYSWMLGDFHEIQEEQQSFFKTLHISPVASGVAIDLGAGNGVQSVSLAKLGFEVKALDFNPQLLKELETHKEDLPIQIIEEDIKNVKAFKHLNPELIICCGDTISHLDSKEEIKQLTQDVFDTLAGNGKFLLSFRDYGTELLNTTRFIPIKSDASRILTCMLEYFPKKVRVTDLLWEKEDEKWEQKVSAYYKVRITTNYITGVLEKVGFKIASSTFKKGMMTVMAEKD